MNQSINQSINQPFRILCNIFSNLYRLNTSTKHSSISFSRPLMMSGVPLETCSAFNERWNNKFCYKVASCWLFLLNHTTMHGSMNIKDKIMKGYFMLVNLYLVLLPSRPSSFVYIPVSLSELLKLLLLMISLYKTQR